MIDLKARAEVGDATWPDEPPAPVCRAQCEFPTPPQAGHAALGRPAFCPRSLARHRAQDGHGTGHLAIQWTMPQDMEAQAGQLRDKFDQRPCQPFSEQVPTLLENEKLRGFGLPRRCQRRGLAFAWALGRGFAVRRLCPDRPCHPATFHAGFHKTQSQGLASQMASARQKSLATFRR